MKRVSFFIALIATVFACSPKEDPAPVNTVPGEVQVSGVILNSSSVALEVGNTASLKATVNPSNAKDKNVTWESDNPAVATVDQNGNVTAVKEGSAKITAKAGGKTATCSVVVKPDPQAAIKASLMKFYDALGGPNWTRKKGWGTDQPLNDWDGVSYDPASGALELSFRENTGLKGDIPECIGELTGLRLFSIYEPGITGVLPESFGKLTSLEVLYIHKTEMTSLPDIFSEMKSLRTVFLQSNLKMTGPLPESIGSSPALTDLIICNNCFTGSVPASWARLGKGLNLGNNCLSGTIPDTFVSAEDSEYMIYHLLAQKEGYGFDISGIEVSGEPFWPKDKISALDGRKFSFKEVIAANKYTMFLIWAPWCPFSRELMPALTDFYKLYHNKGFEIIATVELKQGGGMWDNLAEQKQVIKDKGYDKWYNYYHPSVNPDSYIPSVPEAIVYDQNGNILFDSLDDFPDPEKQRFGKMASSDLMDFLEGIIGPVEKPDTYISTDFSKDGKVTTLQKASVGKGINIVFMGDAFNDKHMDEGGLYDTVMQQAADEFFSVEPYKTFRNRFNVYSVKVVSKSAVVGEGFETALDSHFGTGPYMGGDLDKCYEYAMKVPGIDKRDNLLVTVLVNSRKQGGCAHMSGDTQSSVAFLTTNGNDPELFGPTLNHEAGGHGFAFLDDEYIRTRIAPSQEYIDYRTIMYEKYGWFGNIDFTNDPAKIKWSAFLSDSRYKGEVGIYEGASLHAVGVYKPTENSIMDQDFGGYNAPSRWSIYQRIMMRSGETASFEKFLEYDAINRGNKQSSAPRTRSIVEWVPDAPYVILP